MLWTFMNLSNLSAFCLPPAPSAMVEGSSQREMATVEQAGEGGVGRASLGCARRTAGKASAESAQTPSTGMRGRSRVGSDEGGKGAGRGAEAAAVEMKGSR